MIPSMSDTRTDISDDAAAVERQLSLTPEQALALAIERHQLDELDDAEMIYAALLERWPEHPMSSTTWACCSISAARASPRSRCCATPSRSRLTPPASGTTSGRLGVYDDLDKTELLAYLEAHGDTFDIVVSTDTLCYFGALEGVARAAHRALRRGGQLVFTVEALPDDDCAGHRLLRHGRYAHARDYLRAVLDGAGFVRRQTAADVLRSEGGVPVNGWVVSAGRD
jgi:SAM-dependent methyltransferase